MGAENVQIRVIKKAIKDTTNVITGLKTDIHSGLDSIYGLRDELEVQEIILWALRDKLSHLCYVRDIG